MNCTGRLIVIIVLCGSLCPASEPAFPNSNREIIFQLCDSVAKKIVAEGILLQNSVTIRTGVDTFTSSLRSQFILGLASRNISVFQQSSPSETILEITVRGSTVLYGEVFTESFLGTRKTERNVSLNINAFVVSGSDEKVIWAKQFSESIIDTVNYSETERLNDSTLPLTNYKKAELSFFDSILEPAIVTIASGVAIYLFFTIRS